MVRMIQSKVRRIDTRTAKPPPKKADAELLTPEHRAWRAAVLRLAGHRCQAIEQGKRCTVAAPARLFADRIIERKDGGDPLDVSNASACAASTTRPRPRKPEPSVSLSGPDRGAVSKSNRAGGLNRGGGVLTFQDD
jgi:hypothetical protein